MRRIALVLSAALVAASASAIVPSASAAAPEQPPVTEPAAVPGQLLVGYQPGTAPSERASARAQSEARLLERVVAGAGDRAEVELVALPAGADERGAIERFERNPRVAYAERNWIVTHGATSDDPYYESGELWGTYGDASTPSNQYGSQAAEAWAGGHTGSPGIAVAVIDTGVQVTHPDLAANIWVNTGETAGNGVDDDNNGYVDDVNGWDFHHGDGTVFDPADGDSHGTHVAGTIAGVGGNEIGVAGVAWQAKVITAKFLGPNGGTTANAVKAVEYVTELRIRGEKVIASNNSWGGGGYSQALFDAIERSRTAGLLFVAAAGNGGSDKVGDDNDRIPHYPSSYANGNIVAVASLTSTGARSSFSNYGSTSVDIAAPGSGILSTVPGGYGSKSGTSMATPHVTGGVVLAAASGLTGVTAIKERLLGWAIPTSSVSQTVTGGRLDLSSIHLPPANRAPTASPDSYSVTMGSTLTVGAPGVLGNDTDPDGDQLTAEVVDGPTNGTLVLFDTGGFTYTPDSTGTLTFTYAATDPDGASAQATVTLTVTEPKTKGAKGGGGGGKPSGRGTAK